MTEILPHHLGYDVDDVEEETTNSNTVLPGQDYRAYFKDLHESTAEPTKWVVENLVPVGLQIIGGAPKSFKSTVADTIPALLADWNCQVLPQWCKVSRVTHRPSIILSGEATAGELKWLYQTGFGLITHSDTIFINDDSWDFKLDVKGRRGTLLRMMDAIQPGYVLIDPFRKYHSGDENDSGYVEELLYDLRKWAVQHEACVGLVHHASKDAPGSDETANMDPSRLRGSSALFGAADSVLMCKCLDRRNGTIRINAIHKRGTSWDRTIKLGVPGFGPFCSRRGEELMKDIDKKVGPLMKEGCDAESIGKQIHMSAGDVQESMDKVRRNGGIVS